MKKGKQVIAVRLLEPNTGQLDWLPRNPRQWTREDVARTATSIEEDPDFLEDRPLLVVPHGKKWVVFAGNLRREGCLNAGLESVPCVTYQPEDDADRLTIKRRAMKDNGSFGSWDYDELANAWDDLPLEDWGIEVPEAPSVEDFGEDFTLNDRPKDPYRKVSFQLSEEMALVLQLITKAAQYTPAFEELGEGYEGENKNGVAIYLIAKEWADDRLSGFADVDFKEASEQEDDLREYLRDALVKSGRRAKDVDDLLGTNGMSGHYFGTSQWMFPTYGAYMKMREIMPLDRDYFECKKIEMRAKLMEALKEYKENG